MPYSSSQTTCVTRHLGWRSISAANALALCSVHSGILWPIFDQLTHERGDIKLTHAIPTLLGIHAMTDDDGTARIARMMWRSDAFDAPVFVVLQLSRQHLRLLFCHAACPRSSSPR